MTSYLITGAGRGIGLELARQLANVDHVAKIIATFRGKPSEALSKLAKESSGRVIPIPCEVNVPESIANAVPLITSELDNKGLDVLINNVGIQSFHPDGITSMPDSALTDAFDVNVTSVHRMTSALMPLLKQGKGKTIINISTSLGSISHAPRFAHAPIPAYKISKAALNMLTVQYALEYEKDGFTVLAISPGWLKTDLGSSYADLEPETGVEATLKIILKANPEMNGKLVNIHVPGWENAKGPNQYDGQELPW